MEPAGVGPNDSIANLNVDRLWSEGEILKDYVRCRRAGRIGRGKQAGQCQQTKSNSVPKQTDKSFIHFTCTHGIPAWLKLVPKHRLHLYEAPGRCRFPEIGR